MDPIDAVSYFIGKKDVCSIHQLMANQGIHVLQINISDPDPHKFSLSTLF